MYQKQQFNLIIDAFSSCDYLCEGVGGAFYTCTRTVPRHGTFTYKYFIRDVKSEKPDDTWDTIGYSYANNRKLSITGAEE